MESHAARSSSASRWVTFAGFMFLIAGAANLIWGIGALADKEYLPEDGLLFSTLTFWGWIGVIWGAALLVGSYLLLSGAPSGRTVGLLMAVTSAIFWFFALPVLPIFALTAIIVDSLIIYGLTEEP